MKSALDTVPNRFRTLACALAASLSALAPQSAHADPRFFTYSYEANSLAKGELEFEQWLTHRSGKDGGTYSAWDLREELEYGMTERLTSSVYLNFRQEHSDKVPGKADTDKFKFKGLSSEWRYQILDPQKQPIGISLYAEPTYSGDEFEMEEKLILSKRFGDKWITALNVTFEQEWEFEQPKTETALKLELTAGVAYRLSNRWSVGIEGRNAREFEDMDFSKRTRNAWFVGPNVRYGTPKWGATLTVLPQVAGSPASKNGLNLQNFERVEVRLLVGVDF